MANSIATILSLQLLFLSTTFITNAQQHNSYAQTLNTNLANVPQKLTKLHFYFHDITNGNHPTAVIIARPTNQTTTVGFGTLVMVDDPLTERPEASSKVIGRAQGMYGESSQSETSLFMSMTFYFNQGIYNGSSLSILGRYPVAHDVREMPIVGGSGVFRFAQGYALAKTYKYDLKTGNAISEYNLFVLHHDTSFLV